MRVRLVTEVFTESNRRSSLSNGLKTPGLRRRKVGATKPRFYQMDKNDLEAMQKELAGKACLKSGKRDSKVRFSDHPPTAHPPRELSVVDQKWGTLFDKGVPTQRLEQFLRGLANQIVSLVKLVIHRIYTYNKQMIETQRKTIVVTPAKMAIYYSKYSIDKELHPLHCMYPHSCSLLSSDTI